MKNDKINCKQQLLYLIKPASKQRPYISVKGLYANLKHNEYKVKPATVNRYLATFKKNKIIFDAGRGWYSSIATPFILDLTPVKRIDSIIQKKYPLLDFSCWSTEQISRYGQHLLTKYITFLYTDRENMSSVSEFLINKGYNVYLNPSKTESKAFVIRDKTFVIRPSVKTQPTENHFVKIEGILVELFLEKDDLNLIDFNEYKEIFNNLSRQSRISLSKFLNYAKDRKSSSLIKLVESIKAEFSKNSSLVDLLKTK